MAKTPTPATIESLLEKGDGVLVKRNGVWTYTDAPFDPSGTNLRMPLESVPHAAVQDAIEKGDLVVTINDPTGAPSHVGRRPADGERPVRLLNLAQAGTAEVGTELPLNSRPTHDAGRRPGTVDVAIVQGAPKGSLVPAAPGALVPPPVVVKVQ